MLGDAPLIHGGFLKSWLSSGLHKTVVARVRSVVSKSTVQKADFRIYVTGKIWIPSLSLVHDRVFNSQDWIR